MEIIKRQKRLSTLTMEVLYDGVASLSNRIFY